MGIANLCGSVRNMSERDSESPWMSSMVSRPMYTHIDTPNSFNSQSVTMVHVHSTTAKPITMVLPTFNSLSITMAKEIGTTKWGDFLKSLKKERERCM